MPHVAATIVQLCGRRTWTFIAVTSRHGRCHRLLVGADGFEDAGVDEGGGVAEFAAFGDVA
jgi:hypothetical protein